MNSEKYKKRIFSILETGQVTVFEDYSVPVAGEIVENVIFVNPELGDRIVSVLHECIHYISRMSEYKTEALAKKINRELTCDEIIFILGFIGKEQK